MIATPAVKVPSPGNQALLRRLSAAPVGPRARLRIGDVDDPLEREADAAAETVMGETAPDASLGAAPAGVQRQCADCEDEGEDEPTLQRRASAQAGEGDTAPAGVHAVLAQSGQPLPGETRAFFESRFGQDFSGVRVHDDAAAAGTARSVGAQAYTVGQHIAFDSGQFAPHTPTGQRLLAHELAHTVQQRGGARLVSRRTPDDDPAKKDPAVTTVVGVVILLNSPAQIEVLLTTSDGAQVKKVLTPNHALPGRTLAADQSGVWHVDPDGKPRHKFPWSFFLPARPTPAKADTSAPAAEQPKPAEAKTSGPGLSDLYTAGLQALGKPLQPLAPYLGPLLNPEDAVLTGISDTASGWLDRHGLSFGALKTSYYRHSNDFLERIERRAPGAGRFLNYVLSAQEGLTGGAIEWIGDLAGGLKSLAITSAGYSLRGIANDVLYGDQVPAGAPSLSRSVKSSVAVYSAIGRGVGKAYHWMTTPFSFSVDVITAWKDWRAEQNAKDQTIRDTYGDSLLADRLVLSRNVNVGTKVVIDVATIVVPIAKAGQAAKLAKLAEAARVADAAEALRLAQLAELQAANEARQAAELAARLEAEQAALTQRLAEAAKGSSLGEAGQGGKLGAQGLGGAGKGGPKTGPKGGVKTTPKPVDGGGQTIKVVQPAEESGLAAETTPAAETAAATENAGETVTVFRVEGAGNQRIVIDAGGGVEIPDVFTRRRQVRNLYLNFGDEARAQEFLKQRLRQFPDNVVKTFEVPKSFLEELKSTAVPEIERPLHPNKPVFADPTKAPNQFGLSKEQIDKLKKVIVKGSGKKVE